jgi:hypothetical protein
LQKGNGRDEHGRVIHRTRRMPPSLPARRGMLAPWFRRRIVADGDRPAPPGPEHAPAIPGDVEPVAPDTAGAEVKQPADRSVAVARATFGQRVF